MGAKQRNKSLVIREIEIIPLPKTIIETHSSDSLSMEYVYVQEIPFHRSISKSYKFRTADALRSNKKLNHDNIED